MSFNSSQSGTPFGSSFQTWWSRWSISRDSALQSGPHKRPVDLPAYEVLGRDLTRLRIGNTIPNGGIDLPSLPNRKFAKLVGQLCRTSASIFRRMDSECSAAVCNLL
jgi:hypothetical protein